MSINRGYNWVRIQSYLRDTCVNRFSNQPQYDTLKKWQSITKKNYGIWMFHTLTKEKGMILKVGQKAPDFTLTSHLGNQVRLSDFRDNCNIVLAFFPLAWTPI